MYTSKVKMLDREIEITGSREAIYRIRAAVLYPAQVQQSTKTSGSLTMMVLFGNAWSWQTFPAEKKAAYDAEFAAYVAALPEKITSRTKLETLPDRSWAAKYIPTEEEVAALKEAAKTPEQKAREEANLKARREENERINAEREAKARERNAAEAQLKDEYPDMDTTTEPSVNRAAINIRKVLAKKWPNTKFSVAMSKFSMGDSIGVKWVDGPCDKEVIDAIDRFKAGSFDGMTDSYNEEKERSWRVFGNTKYLNVSRAVSVDRIEFMAGKIKPVMEQAQKSENDSSLFPIGDTGYSIGKKDGGWFSLWSGRYIAEGMDAERLALELLDDQDSKKYEESKPLNDKEPQ